VEFHSEDEGGGCRVLRISSLDSDDFRYPTSRVPRSGAVATEDEGGGCRV
jgi:hypothetical protein